MVIKNAHNLPLILVILACPLLAVADTGIGSKARLGAEKLQTIQSISQNILTAKRKDTPNPELEQLRLRIEELRQVVEKFHSGVIDSEVTLAEPNNITMFDGNKDGKLVVRQEKRDIVKKEKQSNEVEAALGKMRTQRAKFEAAATSRPEHKQGHERKLANKLKELENELESALQAPQAEQTEKLTALSKRLKINSGREERKPDDTPTLTTIVRHRQ